MKLFDFWECINGETHVEIYDILSNALLYEGAIDDIPHKVSRMRNIVPGTTEIKNGILMLYTKICCESNFDLGKINVNFSQVQVRLDSIELMHWRLNCTKKDRFGYYYYNTELDKEGRRPGEELITMRFEGEHPYEVFDLLEHYWGDFNGCPDYKTVLLKCKILYDRFKAVLVQLSHDTLVFACHELSEKDRLEIQEEAKQIKVDIVEFNESGFKWWWD